MNSPRGICLGFRVEGLYLTSLSLYCYYSCKGSCAVWDPCVPEFKSTPERILAKGVGCKKDSLIKGCGAERVLHPCSNWKTLSFTWNSKLGTELWMRFRV